MSTLNNSQQLHISPLFKGDNLRGNHYGRLAVVQFAGTDKYRFAYWRCKCSCGRVVITRSHALKSGHTTSCGCIRFKHGMGRSRTYYSWVEMKRRCLDPFNYNYERYGAVGIRIAKRWMKFVNFLEDMGISPEGKTLDRIDGKKGYSKSNCRWATSREQILNRNFTRWIRFNGKRLCLSDWAKKLGMTPYGLYWRLDVAKWPKKRALTELSQYV